MDQPQPLPPSRRTFLVQSLAAAGLLRVPAAVAADTRLLVPNVTELFTVEVARIEAPRTAAELSSLVKAWPGKIAVGGGRYSMGGQVAIAGGLHVDMRGMNRLVWLRASERTVRVQAGMRWRDLQEHLDPLDLAVKTMQSYANFTVGGSVSVNAHGRYVGHGPLGNTVRALQLVLADGSIIEATPTRNRELFAGAIGGYGAVGIVTEVELDLAPNVRIERSTEEIPLDRYVEHFQARVLQDPTAILHNADLLPPAFDIPIAATWRHVGTDRPLTETARLVPRGRSYALQQNAIWAITEVPGGAGLRSSVIQPLLSAQPAVKWLNCEASADVAELEPRTRLVSTYVLQEYFIPEAGFVHFARALAGVLRRRRVAALNVSIRHAAADKVSLLPWANGDVFCFVLYFKQRKSTAAQERVASWTRELIELALQHGGRHYLPYQLHATRQQFEAAYPGVAGVRDLKRRVDPAGKLSNELWKKYL